MSHAPSISALKFGCGTPVADHVGPVYVVSIYPNTVQRAERHEWVVRSASDGTGYAWIARDNVTPVLLMIRYIFADEEAAWQYLLAHAKQREQVCLVNLNRLKSIAAKDAQIVSEGKS